MSGRHEENVPEISCPDCIRTVQVLLPLLIYVETETLGDCASTISPKVRHNLAERRILRVDSLMVINFFQYSRRLNLKLTEDLVF